MPPDESRAVPVHVSRGRKSLTVDAHCHVLTLEVERLLSSCPEKQSEPSAQLNMYEAESVEYNRKLFANLMLQRGDAKRACIRSYRCRA